MGNKFFLTSVLVLFYSQCGPLHIVTTRVFLNMKWNANWNWCRCFRIPQQWYRRAGYMTFLSGWLSPDWRRMGQTNIRREQQALSDPLIKERNQSECNKVSLQTSQHILFRCFALLEVLAQLAWLNHSIHKLIYGTVHGWNNFLLCPSSLSVFHYIIYLSIYIQLFF